MVAITGGSTMTKMDRVLLAAGLCVALPAMAQEQTLPNYGNYVEACTP